MSKFCLIYMENRMPINEKKSGTQPVARTAVASVIATTKPAPPRSNFDALADDAHIRAAQLVRDPARPDATPPLPFSAPTLWRMVRLGTFPRPVKLAERVTAWRVGAVRAWLAEKTAA